MERKTQSLRVDSSLWKEAKLYCVEKGISISEFVEDLIKKALKK